MAVVSKVAISTLPSVLRVSPHIQIISCILWSRHFLLASQTENMLLLSFAKHVGSVCHNNLKIVTLLTTTSNVGKMSSHLISVIFIAVLIMKY